MSHLRNLFHSPAGQQQGQKALPVAAVLENAHPSAITATSHTTTAVAVPEFPVEQATLCPENRLAYYNEPRSRAADRFRLLRMRLKPFWTAGKLKKLLITSPLAHDGKSTMLLNLATALGERGKKSVLVIEADLHHSTLTETLRLKPWAGLTECLTNETTSPLSLIRRIEPFGWCLMPAGEPRKNATELLQTPTIGHVLDQLSPCFDWILIDSPPVIPLTDSLSLQQHVDASLVVVRAGQTPREAVEQTVELLGKKNIIGFVLNGVEARDHQYYQYYNAAVHDED